MDKYNEMRKEAPRLEDEIYQRLIKANVFFAKATDQLQDSTLTLSLEIIKLREQVRVLELDAIDRDEVNRGLREASRTTHDKLVRFVDEINELKKQLAVERRINTELSIAHTSMQHQLAEAGINRNREP